MNRETCNHSHCWRSIVVFLSALCVLGITVQGQLPWVRKEGPSKARGVILFVHGVRGDGHATWLNGTSFWPEMLTHDKTFDGQDVYVYTYPSPTLSTSSSISEVADTLYTTLENDDVLKYKQITIVSHSMGGIVTRELLVRYHREMEDKIRFLYFFSTPTTGSGIASVVHWISENNQFAQLAPMNNPDSFVRELQSNWLAARFNFKSYCAYELLPAHGKVVEIDSATHLCTEPPKPIEATHTDIVKPSSDRSPSYMALKAAFIETVATDRTSRNALTAKSTAHEGGPNTPSTGGQKSAGLSAAAAQKSRSVESQPLDSAPGNGAGATSSNQQGGITAGTVNVVLPAPTINPDTHIQNLMANVGFDDALSLDELILLETSLSDEQQRRVDAVISQQEYLINQRSFEGARTIDCADPTSMQVLAVMRSADVEDRRGQLFSCNEWLDRTYDGDLLSIPHEIKFPKIATYVQTLVQVAIHDPSLRIRHLALTRVNQIFSSSEGYPQWTLLLKESQSLAKWYQAHDSDFEMVLLLATTRYNGGLYGDSVAAFDELQELRARIRPHLFTEASEAVDRLKATASTQVNAELEQRPDKSKPLYDETSCPAIIADMTKELANPEIIRRTHINGFSTGGVSTLTYSFLPELAFLRSCPIDRDLDSTLSQYAAHAASLAGRYEAIETLNFYTGENTDPFDTKKIQLRLKSQEGRHHAVK